MTGDTVYGRATALRRWLEAEGRPHMLAVPRNESLVGRQGLLDPGRSARGPLRPGMMDAGVVEDHHARSARAPGQDLAQEVKTVLPLPGVGREGLKPVSSTKKRSSWPSWRFFEACQRGPHALPVQAHRARLEVDVRRRGQGFGQGRTGTR